MKYGLFFFGAAAFVCVWCVLATHQVLPDAMHAPPPLARHQEPPALRTVHFLAWTTMFGAVLRDERSYCGSGLWYTVTSDKRQLANSTALLFHGQDYGRSHTPPRDPMQPWIVRSMESPVSDSGSVDRTSPQDMGAFNLSSTYEWTSDGWIPYAPNDLSRLLRPVVPASKRTKSAPIVWVAGNCGASNHRQEFIRQLMKLVRVDSFGACLRNKDWDSTRLGRGRNNTAFHEFLGTYKFYLAFENTDCVDYLTEKFWRALEFGMIPIVLGAPNAGDYAPAEKSIIKVTDFESIQALADYINLLDSNDTLFEEYMWYKNTQTLRRRPQDVMRPEFIRMFRRVRSECALAQRVLDARERLQRTGEPTHAAVQPKCLDPPAWKSLKGLEKDPA